MCSSMLLVVQSTIVTASIVRGSAPSPTTISLRLTRSWASADPASATATARAVTKRKTDDIESPFYRRREPGEDRGWRVTGARGSVLYRRREPGSGRGWRVMGTRGSVRLEASG